MFFAGFGLHFLEKNGPIKCSQLIKLKQTQQHFVFVYLISRGITVFTASKPLKLFVSLEKCASWSGLGSRLALAKVIGFTAFKPLKLLVSFKKSASCPFDCCETACVVRFT